MNARSIRHVKEQRGIVLILSLLVMTILAVLGLAFLAMARTEDAIASNYRNHTAAFYAAEAGLESGVATLKSLLGTSPTPTDLQLAALLPPALTDPNYTFDTFQVGRVRPNPPYNYQTVIATGPYAGMAAQTTDYVITATVRGPRGSRARLNQTVQSMVVPLFQFAVFYGKGVDLEMSPGGSTMNLNGRVHANSDIYIAAGGAVDIDSTLTSAGHIYRHMKFDSAFTGNSSGHRIKDATGTYQTLDFDYQYQPGLSSPWASEADYVAHAESIFGGTVKDSAMGIQDILPPVPDVLYDPVNPDTAAHQMIEKGVAGDSDTMKAAKMYYQADLRIENGAGKAMDGSPVPMGACGAISTKTFYDAREGANVTVTEVDIGQLDACGLMPANGILYVSKSGANGGVRLVNGATLPSQGLTVVSDNPVYVQGDYNTVNKVPAAIMGDAITILSNNWGPNGSDTKGNQIYTDRPASATTINAAFMMGPSQESVPDGGETTSNGNLENAIRMLEDWKTPPGGRQTLTYRGSMVSLWHSQQATGQWNYGTFYKAPNRDFGYDTLFDTSLPPGTPMGPLGTTRGQWSEG